MPHSCRHYFEEDGEYCKAKRQPCTCSGGLTQCDYPAYFDLSDEAVARQRILDCADRATAQVAPFVGR